MPLPETQVGIIPLHPLRLGEIFEGAFKAIRTNPAVMLVLSAIVVVALSAVSTALMWGPLTDLESFGTGDPQTFTEEDSRELLSTLESAIVGNLISAGVSMIVTTLLTGLLMQTVSQSIIGRKLSLGQAWREAAPMFLRLIGLTIIVTVLMSLPIVIAIAIFAALLATESIGLIILAGLTLLVLGVAGVLFLMTCTVLATPALMLERCGVFRAFGRGWRLALRSFWRILGIYLLTVVMVGIAASMAGGMTGLIGAAIPPAASVLLTTAVTTIAQAFTTPFLASVTALLYVDQRMRYEGLDAELITATQPGNG